LSIWSSFKPIPKETITTMEAVPIITPRTVRKVRSFRRLKLLRLMLRRSGNLIVQLLFLLLCLPFLSHVPDYNRSNDSSSRSSQSQEKSVFFPEGRFHLQQCLVSHSRIPHLV